MKALGVELKKANLPALSPSHSVGLERFTTSKIHRFGTGYVTIPHSGLGTER